MENKELVRWLNRLIEMGEDNQYEDGLNINHHTSNAFIRSRVDTAKVFSFIEKWAAENSINLFCISPEGLETPFQYRTWSTNENPARLLFDQEVYAALNKPNTVIVCRDLHKMEDKKVRRLLLDFFNNPVVLTDEKATRFEYMKNILFTIGIIGTMTNSEFWELVVMDAKQWPVLEFDEE